MLEALLTATLLADVRLLGRAPREANTIAFHADEPERAAVWIAERIRSARLGHRLWDGSERDIEEHIRRVDFDLGKLLMWLMGLDQSAVAGDISWMPWSILYEPDLSPQDTYVGPALADSHLHSGAALDDLQFLRLLVASTGAVPADPPTLRVKDPGGVEYDLKILVHGLRHYIRSLTLPGGLVETWGGGSAYWGRVRLLLSGTPLYEEDISDLWTNHGPSDPDRAVRAVRSALADCSHPCQVSLASALILLAHAVRSRESETLGTFVDRFELVGGLRDSALDASRARVIERSCWNVYSSASVQAAEFRKTVTVARRPFGRQPIISKPLTDHLEGCGLFRLETGRRVKFSMPLSFVRDLENGAPASDELISHYRWTDVCAVASGIVAFVTEHPEAAPFIGGLDVVGNELNTSNWPFVVLYREMRARCSIPVGGYSAHAGEFFRHRLQGLRSIGELVLPDCVVRRLGHGLALSETTRTLTDSPRLTHREVLEDLLWLIAAELEEVDARLWLDLLLSDSRAKEMVPIAEDWVTAWRLRRSWAGLHSVGLVGSDPFASLDWPAERLMLRELRNSTSGPRRALIMLIYRGVGASNYLDAPVGNDFRSQYLSWAEGIAPNVSDALIRAVKAEGVIVESCPTSNLRLSSMRGYEDHPLPQLLGAGLSVTLNSDDPLMFGTNIVREARIVRHYFGEDCLNEVAETSVASCCAELDNESCDPAVIARFLYSVLGYEGDLWRSISGV